MSWEWSVWSTRPPRSISTVKLLGGVLNSEIIGGPDSISDPKKRTAPWYIGAVNPKARMKGILDGVIDEVRLYNRALSVDEVTELYLFTSAFPPAE